MKIAGDENRPAALRVELLGSRAGAEFKRVMGASGSCTEAAVNLVLSALRRLATGGVDPGVYTAEGLLEPRDALQALETAGVRFWREDR